MDWQKFSEKAIRQMFDDGLEIEAEDMAALSQDSRAGVKRLVTARGKEERERARVDRLYRYEREIHQMGVQFIAGLDEVGRGPLAGPVVAAAVILPRECFIAGINDSKKIAPARRSLIAAEIKEKALAWAVGAVGSWDIDRINILQASCLAMRRALKQLAIAPEYLLIDGMTIEDVIWPQRGIIGGDALSASIAAASIIAKCHRDSLMEIYDQRYPGYGFSQHKGYPTSEHCQNLRQYGATPIHRKSFNYPGKNPPRII